MGYASFSLIQKTITMGYLLLIGTSGLAQSLASPQTNVETQILPLLRNSCAGCHGADRQEAGLRLDSIKALVKGGSSGPAIAWGNSRGSLLFQRVTATDQKLRMPPAGAALSPKQIALIS